MLILLSLCTLCDETALRESVTKLMLRLKLFWYTSGDNNHNREEIIKITDFYRRLCYVSLIRDKPDMIFCLAIHFKVNYFLVISRMIHSEVDYFMVENIILCPFFNVKS